MYHCNECVISFVPTKHTQEDVGSKINGTKTTALKSDSPHCQMQVASYKSRVFFS